MPIKADEKFYIWQQIQDVCLRSALIKRIKTCRFVETFPTHKMYKKDFKCKPTNAQHKIILHDNANKVYLTFFRFLKFIFINIREIDCQCTWILIDST